MPAGNQAHQISAFDHDLTTYDDPVPSACLPVRVPVAGVVLKVVELENEEICVGALLDSALSLESGSELRKAADRHDAGRIQKLIVSSAGPGRCRV